MPLRKGNRGRKKSKIEFEGHINISSISARSNSDTGKEWFVCKLVEGGCAMIWNKSLGEKARDIPFDRFYVKGIVTFNGGWYLSINEMYLLNLEGEFVDVLMIGSQSDDIDMRDNIVPEIPTIRAQQIIKGEYYDDNEEKCVRGIY